MDKIFLTKLSYGGSEHEIEVKLLQYASKLIIFVIPVNGRFGTIVIGESEPTEEENFEEEVKDHEYNVWIVIGDWKWAPLYEMLMRNLIESLNKSDESKPKY